MLKRCSCPNCLGTEMKRVAKGVYQCKYCDSFFLPEDSEDPATEKATRRLEKAIRKTEEKLRKMEEKEDSKVRKNTIGEIVEPILLTILTILLIGLSIEFSLATLLFIRDENLGLILTRCRFCNAYNDLADYLIILMLYTIIAISSIVCSIGGVESIFEKYIDKTVKRRSLQEIIQPIAPMIFWIGLSIVFSVETCLLTEELEVQMSQRYYNEGYAFWIILGALELIYFIGLIYSIKKAFKAINRQKVKKEN